MPWRLVLSFFIMFLLIIFIVLNLDNRVDISFGFYVFKDLPVFIGLFASFVAGSLVILPFTLKKGKKKEKPCKEIKDLQKEIVEPIPVSDSVSDKKGKKNKADN